MVTVAPAATAYSLMIKAVVPMQVAPVVLASAPTPPVALKHAEVPAVVTIVNTTTVELALLKSLPATPP